MQVMFSKKSNPFDGGGGKGEGCRSEAAGLERFFQVSLLSFCLPTKGIHLAYTGIQSL